MALKAQPAPDSPTGSRASTQAGPAPAPGPATQETKDSGRTEGLSDATEETMREQEAREEQGTPGETKEDKFKRLGKARMNRALTAIASLGKLSGSSYTSTPEQQGNMFRALRKAVDDAEGTFKPKGSDKPAFDF